MTGQRQAKPDISVRPFYAGDEETFRALNEAWITRYFRLEERDHEILSKPQAIIDAGGSILMALAGDIAVGCCALVAAGEGTYEVSKMAVSPEYQGRGIGRILMSGVIEEARRLGAKRLYLETNKVLVPAIRLYESAGFKHIPPEELKPSPYARANVHMELFLTSPAKGHELNRAGTTLD